MKTISDHTIFCTPEQTRTALELGAPLETRTNKNHFINVGFYSRGQFVSYSYDIPTAEQMIGWLETQGGIEEITVCKTGMWVWGKNHTLIDGSPNYSSRQEATLAAIDAALKYLSNKK